MKEPSQFRIAIIGLGLIGGSLAYALKGFKNAVIVGADTDEDTRSAAIKQGAVSEVYGDGGDAVKGADFVIICIYPNHIADFIRQNARRFKEGAVITDVCGTKRELAGKIEEVLPRSVDFVGGHPMAGKEVDGFRNADKAIFENTGFIITPLAASKSRSIALVREMAEYIGATRIAQCTPKEHDEIIAYTSDLMHLSAAALCLDFHPGMTRAYAAGAFRDCTRVADINPTLWSELFLHNKTNVLHEIDRFLGSMGRIRNAIAEEDGEELCRLLAAVRENKKEMQSR